LVLNQLKRHAYNDGAPDVLVVQASAYQVKRGYAPFIWTAFLPSIFGQINIGEINEERGGYFNCVPICCR
jgi:hypothetical protein